MIDPADRASVTVGITSSSVRVSVTAVGSATPRPPAAVAVTVTVLFAASTVLSNAVSVTVPVLVRWPAAMVSMVPVCVKSVPAPGDAATVSRTASLDLPESVDVTVETPPASVTDDGATASVTVGVGSSSVVVTDTSSVRVL